MINSTTPENVRAVDKLASALEQLPVGETISYLALQAAVPGWNQHRHAWLLAKARERVEKQLGCVLATVRDTGIKRLPPADIPGVGIAALGRIRRQAKRGKARLDRVNTNSLPADEQRRVIGMRSMLGAVAVIADGRRTSSVGAVADPVRPVPSSAILAMFRKPES